MRRIKVKFQDKEVNIAPTMKAAIIFEKMLDKPFEIKTLEDRIAYIYAMIYANNPDTQITVDDILDECDDRPEFITDCYSVFNDELSEGLAVGKRESPKKRKSK